MTDFPYSCFHFPPFLIISFLIISLIRFLLTATDRPDYGLEELSTANVRQKFAMFEQAAQEDEGRADPVQVRRSSSLLNRAAK